MTEAREMDAEVCPYRAICQPCEGPRADYRVLLTSGESSEFRNVVSIVLTESDLIVTPAVGAPVTFARRDVYFAGCGRLAVPGLG
jgi:hypothetical protein